MASARESGRLARNHGVWQAWRFTVRTHVHVITRANGTGGVTRDQIRRQIKVINDGYAGRTSDEAAWTPFKFVLKSVDYTANDDWFEWSGSHSSDDREAKTALHQGGWADLNVYIANLEELLGYAYYPRTISLKRDGVVLLNESLPGGSAAPFNLGDTATHEIGHWLDLLHTFQDGCTPPGDFVWDTPFQDDGPNIFSCEESLDTCKQEGKDPVHNFMSYGDDPCLDRFSEGQGWRMRHAWLALRFQQ